MFRSAMKILPTPSIATPGGQPRAALVAAGYSDRGEMGIPGRVGFYKPGFGRRDFKGSGNAMRRNTYLILEGGLSLRNHLDLKRILLSDADLREDYGDVKKRLAANELEGESEYARGKN